MRLRREMVLGNFILRVILHDVMPAPKLRNVNSVEMRESLLSLIPNVRAFAVVLCGDPERADEQGDSGCCGSVDNSAILGTWSIWVAATISLVVASTLAGLFLCDAMRDPLYR
jgi:hypothetical protein